MLFKNAYIYRLTHAFDYTHEALEEHLATRAFVPCAGARASSFGWISPVPEIDDGPFSHEVAGAILLKAKREDKIVPPSALNDAIVERVRKLESAEGRPLRAKEKQGLKEVALAELLPRALPRSKQVMGYISPRDRLLVIGTSASSEAEMFIDCLRDSFSSFPVTIPQVKSKPSDAFTHWLLHRKLPEPFSLGDQCDLMDPEDTSTVTCRRQDLATGEIRQHIEAGKICTRIGLRWHGDLKFAIDRDLALKQIKVESSDDDTEDDDDPIARLDAAFVNMTLEFSRMLPALFEALGGEKQADD
ncbi:MAG: recombination-associated protein RdgC [Pseudomonadales bacterium]|nr:recombination-associated protein RdgC [Pseudomonadales bacterium]